MSDAVFSMAPNGLPWRVAKALASTLSQPIVKNRTHEKLSRLVAPFVTAPAVVES